MSWAVGYDSTWGRDIGYGVPAVCDHPKCNAQIDRGLSYVCGGEPYGGKKGCGLFFCNKHLVGYGPQRCPRCAAYKPPYAHPKPDTREWANWKLTDPSWAQWRKENQTEAKRLRAYYCRASGQPSQAMRRRGAR